MNLSFQSEIRFIRLVLSLKKLDFFVYGDCIYPIEPEIKDTIATYRSASYLDLQKVIESIVGLRTKFYDKRDDFDFSSQQPHEHTDRAFIFHLILYSRVCASYKDFSYLDAADKEPTDPKLFPGNIEVVTLNFSVAIMILVNRYEISISQKTIQQYLDVMYER